MSDDPEIIERFLSDVAAFLDTRSLLPPRAGVVVGVSGGADSVALLAALRRLAAQPGRQYRLIAAHLNHCLRPDAQADADFVAELARRWGIPCVVARREVAVEARAAGQGVEQAARAARYEFLTQTALAEGASHVAVAHHADDNVETVLYRIIRGTHLRGLAGIPAARELGTSGVVLIRPLLERKRAQIEEFCQAEGLAWRTDSTNADTGYRRNFIRHELLPLLRSRLNLRADEAVLRLAEAAASAEEVLCDLARAAVARAIATAPSVAGHLRKTPSSCAAPLAVSRDVSLDISCLAPEHPLVRAVAIRIVLEDLGVPMRSFDADRMGELQSMLAGAGPVAVELPGGWTVRAQAGRLAFLPPSKQGGAPAVAPEVAVLECPGRTVLADGRRVLCRIEPLDAAAFERHCKGHPPGTELLDAAQVRGRLVCRPRRPGDSFEPLGAPGRQSVSDFLTNGKLPAPQREEVRCICDELGIVYLAPLRIDHRVRVTTATQEVLTITFR
jgi:tRNA(Ile)-lysidine synthase